MLTSLSRLLTKPMLSSRFVSLSLEDAAKLESCVCSQIESQSFSLWALAFVFEFLKESDCIPDSPVFHQLVTLVSHLPVATHASVKHALLSSPSTSSFLEEVVR